MEIVKMKLQSQMIGVLVTSQCIFGSAHFFTNWTYITTVHHMFTLNMFIHIAFPIGLIRTFGAFP